MKQHFKDVRRTLLANGKQLVLFELLYKGVFALLMIPLLEFSLRYAVKFSGYSYVTPENIFYVLRKPATLLCLLVLLGILFLFAFVELISLLVFFGACEERQTLKVGQILFPGCKRAVWMMKTHHLGGLAAGTFLFFLISNLPLWIAFYMRFSIVRLLLHEAWKLPLLRFGAVVLLALLLLLGFLGFFSMHYCCLKNTTFLEGMRRSIHAMAAAPKQLAAYILLWNLRFLLLEAIVYFIGLLVLILVCSMFVSEHRLFAVLMIAEDSWNLYGGIVAAAVLLIAQLGMLSHLFCTVLNKEDANREDFSRENLDGEKRNKEDIRKYQEDTENSITGTDRTYGKLLWVLALLALVGNIANLTVLFWNGSFLEKELLQDIAITAHRGDSSAAPENTLSALEMAIENLADYAEIDVQETADGVVVLMHDYNMKRTTGREGYVWNITYDALSRYDCGSWFSEEFAGERVPTLEQVLELCKGKIYLNIELKGVDSIESLAEKVVRLVEEYGFERQCVISSKNRRALLHVKELNGEIKTGYIMSFAYGSFYETDDIDFFSIKSEFVNETVVQEAHLFGKEIHVWTVNSRSELERMKLLGVDNIITDAPILAREVLEGEGLTGTLFELFRMVLGE